MKIWVLLIVMNGQPGAVFLDAFHSKAVCERAVNPFAREVVEIFGRLDCRSEVLRP